MMTSSDAPLQSHLPDRHSFVKILQLHQAMSRTVATTLAPCDIDLDDYLVLDEVFRRGRLDLTDLAGQVPIERLAVSRAIQNLLDRACLVPLSDLNRFSPPYDISPAGRALHMRARALMMSLEDSLLKRSDKDFVAHLDIAIDTLHVIRDFTAFAAERHLADQADD